MGNVTLYQFGTAEDPLNWLTEFLPQIIQNRNALDGAYPAQSVQVFQKFLGEFQLVEISAGLPHNDYGQTITLSEGRVDLWQPKADDKIDSLSLPDRLEGYKNCSRIRRENERGFFEEDFLLEYSPGFRPSTFTELIRPMRHRWFREVSDILHLLIRFEVALTENGTIVKMRTLKSEGNKPPFVMGS